MKLSGSAFLTTRPYGPINQGDLEVVTQLVKSKAPTIPPNLKSARLLPREVDHPNADGNFLATKVFVHGSVGKTSSSQMAEA